jgi:hypothetical protein
MYPQFADWTSERFEAWQLGPRGGGRRNSGKAGGCDRLGTGGGWLGGLLGLARGLEQGGGRAGEGARWRPTVVAAASRVPVRCEVMCGD